MNFDYDVIVVGAGPGGSTAARFCSKAGLKTLIIEKERLPDTSHAVVASPSRLLICSASISVQLLRIPSMEQNSLIAPKIPFSSKKRSNCIFSDEGSLRSAFNQ